MSDDLRLTVPRARHRDDARRRSAPRVRCAPAIALTALLVALLSVPLARRLTDRPAPSANPAPTAVAVTTGITGITGTTGTTRTAGVRLMAVGDSITDGSGLEWWMQSWPERLFTREFGPDRTGAVVLAHGGQCLVATVCIYGPPLVRTWPVEVLDAADKPSTVALLIGRNDLGHVTDDEFLAALHELVDSAAGRGTRVLVGTIPPSSSSYPSASLTEPQRRRINDRIRGELAPLVFDDAASIGDLLDGVYDSGDGVHPSWPGHVLIADSVPLAWIT